MNPKRLRRRISFCILFFMFALLISGLTAFPLGDELTWLNNHRSLFPGFLADWISKVAEGVNVTADRYPFIAYGTDWLAFAHIVIAVAFIGPYRDPIKNIWVIQFGMISCVMVFPLALIAGNVRGIPFYWQMIDCSFGVFGFLLLYWCYRNIQGLQVISEKKNI